MAFLASDTFFHLPAEAHLYISLWQYQKNFCCGLPNITIAPHLSRVGILVSELLVN